MNRQLNDAADPLSGSPTETKTPDMRNALRWFLVLDLFIRLFLWTGALGLAFGAMNSLNWWPHENLEGAGWGLCWVWGKRIGGFVIFFNLFYVSGLIVLRMLTPTPTEGRYPLNGGPPNRQLLFSAILGALAKARYDAPFPGFFVFHVANLPPLCWLMGPIFGPKSKSCYAVDPNILDPQGVTLGRNVTIGFNTTVAGHYQDREALTIKRTIIEDNAVVGAHSAVGGGAHIKAGAVIRAGSIVLPNTVVGENEFWGGSPARRLRELPPTESLTS